MDGVLSYEELFNTWERFVNGAEEVPGIASNILSSWQRCRRNNLDPRAKPLTIDKEKYTFLVQKNKMLIDLVAPFLGFVDKIVQGTGFVILLTDRNGFVLCLKGDEPAVRKAQANYLGICANRSEAAAGTNAIGLAIVEEKAVQLVGPEHYNIYHHDWTCAAAPIHDTQGNIIGVLNMSGHYTLVHKHTLGMVMYLVQAIEREICIREKNRKLRLANQHLKAIIDSVSEGVITINNKGNIVEANANIQKIFHIAQQKLPGLPASAIFGDNMPLLGVIDSGLDYFDQEETFTVNGRKFNLETTARRLRNEQNKVVGVVGILKEKKDLYRMVNRVMGATAKFTFADIVYKSAVMTQAIAMAQQVADTESRVLLEGESGTGKELFVQAIHNASNRKNGPFIAVNCSAIPNELIESELFGYDEGAFTGAKKRGNPGKFELAEGGTLFLDEINSMPLEMQAKLLRVLQQNEVTRIGGRQTITLNVRIISAANQSVDRLVREGHFRLDLFYRLGVMVIRIPPLRERVQDIPLLFARLLRQICQKSGKLIDQYDDDLIPLLCSYPWPGNVRELENYIERAVVLAREGCLRKEHFPEKVCHNGSEAGDDNLKPLAKQEKEVIEKALQMFGGNISKAAKVLGISRNTLYSRMKDYNIRVKCLT